MSARLMSRTGASAGTGQDGLAAALSGGQAQAVPARTPALAPVVHRAFTDGLDLACLVAAGFGLIAAVSVFALVRRAPKAAAPVARQAAAETEPAAASAEPVPAPASAEA